MRHVSNSRLAVLLLLAATAATGCINEGDDLVVPPARPRNVREKLTSSTTLAELQSGAQIVLTAQVGADATPTPVDVRLDGGVFAVSARTDGSLVLSDLDVAIDDVVLGEAGGPIEGLHLTNLRGKLVGPTALETTWIEGDDEAFGTGLVSLYLDWSIETDSGEVTPLMTQRIDDIELELRVLATYDGELAVEAIGVRTGVFWHGSQQIELSDLSLEATAVEL